MQRRSPWSAIAAAAMMGCAMLRWRVPRGLLAVMVLAFALGMVGCGGSGGSSPATTTTATTASPHCWNLPDACNSHGANHGRVLVGHVHPDRAIAEGILPGMQDVPMPALVDVEFTLRAGSGTMRTVVPVPSGQVTITDLLPILQTFTSGVAGQMARVATEHGQPVSCGPKCGACCRQLVPISNFEAEGLAAWIRSLPAEQQALLAARFHQTLLVFQEKGLLARMNPQMFELATDAFKQLGLEYFSAGVPCPFLVEESCSIHPLRPLVCREYMVTSPPEFCAEPGHQRAMGLRLPVQPSRALMQLGRRVDGDAQGWLPLVFLFHWMAAGIEAGKAVMGSGPEVLREFVDALGS